MGEGREGLLGTGPPPGCSGRALVSTWLCPLSASQRAAEWGSIETNSLCRTQLMGLPGPGRRGAAAGLWLLILPHKHARNLPPGICPVTITSPAPSKPTSFSVHTWIHPETPPPTGGAADRGGVPGCPQSSRPQWTRDRGGGAAVEKCTAGLSDPLTLKAGPQERLSPPRFSTNQRDEWFHSATTASTSICFFLGPFPID